MIYFLINRLKPLEMPWLSSEFSTEPKTFTLTSRAPTSVLLYPHNQGQLRSIVIEKNPNEPFNVLSLYGQMMERMLTEEKKDFQSKLFSSINSKSSSSPSSHSFLSQSNNESYAHVMVRRKRID